MSRVVRPVLVSAARGAAGWCALTVLLLALSGCGILGQPLAGERAPTAVIRASLQPVLKAEHTATAVDTATAVYTATVTTTATRTQSPTVTATLLPSRSPTITASPEPPGCWRPPEDYSRMEVNGWVLNRRTYAMLEHAASLYGGELEITGYHITQGSYNRGVSASFGTHDGGGAVDLSVMRKGTWTVLWEDIDRLIPALRAAGFAAWLRTYGELYPDSPYHIHAVAIGDQELSPAASDQITGPFGYFRGYTGVPIPSGIPVPDRHGGPLLCQWMLDLGFTDLRETSE